MALPPPSSAKLNVSVLRASQIARSAVAVGGVEPPTAPFVSLVIAQAENYSVVNGQSSYHRDPQPRLAWSVRFRLDTPDGNGTTRTARIDAETGKVLSMSGSRGPSTSAPNVGTIAQTLVTATRLEIRPAGSPARGSAHNQLKDRSTQVLWIDVEFHVPEGGSNAWPSHSYCLGSARWRRVGHVRLRLEIRAYLG